MNRSSISNSNGLLLTGKEWIAALLLFAAVCGVVYYGWFRWEKFAPPPKDYRSECFGDEHMQDYWAFIRWTQRARGQYRVCLIGDSVFWGEDARYDATISHFLNVQAGAETFANTGVDGLHPTAIRGLVKYYGGALDGQRVLLECNPFWWSAPKFDLQEDWGAKGPGFYHPRLAPLRDVRINYHHRKFEERLGYVIENYLPLFALVHHIMMKYFDNMSVSDWVLKHPYRNPLAAITFEETPLEKEDVGEKESWNAHGSWTYNPPWLPPAESVQWCYFKQAIGELRSRNAEPFVILGPYLREVLTPASGERQERGLEEVRAWLKRNRVAYFDAGPKALRSADFGDKFGHLIGPGNAHLAELLWKDAGFQRWLNHDPLPAR